MSFPAAPVDGDLATVNGIKYSYSSATNSWTRTAAGKFAAAAAASPPSNPALGDQWYNTNLDILFEYINDGTSSYWVDIISAGQASGNITAITDSTLQGNIVVGLDNVYSIGAITGYLNNFYANSITANVTTVNGNIAATNLLTNTITANAITVNGNILPGTNIAYNLGSSTQRFKDLWLAGNTIFIGGANISTDGSNVTITNPQGGSLRVIGSNSNYSIDVNSQAQTQAYANMYYSVNNAAGDLTIADTSTYGVKMLFNRAGVSKNIAINTTAATWTHSFTGIYQITIVYRQHTGGDVWTALAVTKNGAVEAVGVSARTGSRNSDSVDRWPIIYSVDSTTATYQVQHWCGLGSKTVWSSFSQSNPGWTNYNTLIGGVTGDNGRMVDYQIIRLGDL